MTSSPERVTSIALFVVEGAVRRLSSGASVGQGRRSGEARRLLFTPAQRQVDRRRACTLEGKKKNRGGDPLSTRPGTLVAVRSPYHGSMHPQRTRQHEGEAKAARRAACAAPSYAMPSSSSLLKKKLHIPFSPLSLPLDDSLSLPAHDGSVFSCVTPTHTHTNTYVHVHAHACAHAIRQHPKLRFPRVRPPPTSPL